MREFRFAFILRQSEFPAPDATNFELFLSNLKINFHENYFLLVCSRVFNFLFG